MQINLIQSTLYQNSNGIFPEIEKNSKPFEITEDSEKLKQI